MGKARILIITAVTLLLAACGDFEWFPKVEDTTAPVLKATVAGKQVFTNRSTHVSTLPVAVTLSANEPATIYYTTNGSDPSTASASADISSENGSTDIAVTLTNTILKFFGIDKSAKKNQSPTQTIHIFSP